MVAVILRAVVGTPLLCSLIACLSACGPGSDDAGEVRGLVLHEPEAFEGYTLFSPLLSTSTYLVDMQGRVVHTWESDLPPGNSVALTNEGRLLRCGRTQTPTLHGALGAGGRIRLLEWDGTIAWEWFLSNDERLAHHDVELLPSGNLLVIAWETKTKEEAIAVGRQPGQIGTPGFWPDFLLEVRPVPPDGGEIVWEWHAWDHLIQDQDESKPNYGNPAEAPHRIDINHGSRTRQLTAEEQEREAETVQRMKALGYMGDDDEPPADEVEPPAAEEGLPRLRPSPDWMHTNCVEYHAEHDLIMLSVRGFNEFWVIDHSTTTAEARGGTGGRWGRGGDLLYRWGNPQTYGLGDASDRRLFLQHDARWIPEGTPGAGNALVFNNDRGRPGQSYSSVEEVVLPFDPERGFLREAGAPFGPDESVWSYTAPDRESFYSFIVSSAHRVPNGNTLVCDGPAGRLFEVTREGRVVWDYLNPFGPSDEWIQSETNRPAQLALGRSLRWGVFRATRIPADHPGLAGRARTPLKDLGD